MGAYLSPEQVALVIELCSAGTLWNALREGAVSWEKG